MAVVEIPARKGKAARVRKGQRVKVPSETVLTFTTEGAIRVP